MIANNETERQILRARAAALARRRNEVQSRQDESAVVMFLLAKEQYAIEQTHVREVCLLKDLTPLPCAPSFVVGIINLRGEILPVINIGRFFDLPESGIIDIHMVIVVRVEDVEVGILADAVVGVRSIAADALHSPPVTAVGVRAQYVRGVTSQGIIVLDVPRILNDPRATVNDTVEA